MLRFIYLSIIERVIGIYGGYLDHAAEVAKAGLPLRIRNLGAKTIPQSRGGWLSGGQI
ncbi:hypothetical protein L211DRAFT_838148 [Terfezia boudieri ATCC MYA-4762]|uniref:Uncharacterized protein n=1 Tax=Terfezia boudieri ATCC MYA-4762 TaxID=1051890 RepID=A0A3N4LLP3_9PEZI|nr:hypothetical protein L211DRAFT_838148 [Terfezia boudieri ATCC MYA-4762]